MGWDSNPRDALHACRFSSAAAPVLPRHIPSHFRRENGFSERSALFLVLPCPVALCCVGCQFGCQFFASAFHRLGNGLAPAAEPSPQACPCHRSAASWGVRIETWRNRWRRPRPGPRPRARGAGMRAPGRGWGRAWREGTLTFGERALKARVTLKIKIMSFHGSTIHQFA